MDRENLEALSDEELKAELKKEAASHIPPQNPQCTAREMRLLDEAVRRGIYRTEEVRVGEKYRSVADIELGFIRPGTGKPWVLDCATGEFKQWE